MPLFQVVIYFVVGGVVASVVTIGGTSALTGSPEPVSKQELFVYADE